MDHISRQYLAMLPTRSINWKMILSSWEDLAWSVQEELLKATIQHPRSISHPPSINYRRAFLKYLITNLEKSGVDLCDSMYEEYTTLLSESEESEGEWCYKTYTDTKGHTVTMRESKQLISQGTTGLSTWQAAQHLAEWALENKNLFDGKNTLELGSGLGFTGLIVCKHCRCKQFRFTDCHYKVLQTLAFNISLNVTDGMDQMVVSSGEQSEHTSEKRSDNCCKERCGSLFCERCWSKQSSDNDEDTFSNWKNSYNENICLSKLDWEKSEQRIIQETFKDVQVVLAADVVYDSSIIPALVKVLRCLLVPKDVSQNISPVAYIASTIRNENTRDEFLLALGESRINYARIDGPRNSIFFYDKSVPIEILRLTAS